MNAPTFVPMVVRTCSAAGFLRTNSAFEETFGLDVFALQELPLREWIHPDDRDAFERELQQGSGCVRARHRTVTDAWLSLDWEVRTHLDEVVVLGRLHGDRPVPAHSPGGEPTRRTMEETLNAMALVVEAKNPGRKCSILLVDPAREYIIGGAGPNLPDAYNKAVEGLRIGPGVGSCGTAAFWNIPVVVENIAEDPLWRNLRDEAALAGVCACWSHPIVAANGDVLGAMALYGSVPSAPSPHEMDGLETAARMVGLAIERDRLEEQLRHAAKMEALGVLAGGIAHDFNNLLSTVMGNAELALSSLPEGASATPMMSEIVAASTSASELCNQLLAYAGRGARSKETIECNALLSELGGLLNVALSKKTRLVYELHPAPLGLRADRSQLRQVIMNLITNAAEAVGDVASDIVIGTEPVTCTREELESQFPGQNLVAGEYVRTWVSDAGIGMSPLTQARIFDPFFTTKANGRGLGLAAVQGIVRGHQGAIRLESTEGVGTKCVVLLPRTAVGKVDADDSRWDQAPVPGAQVLVVDDEPAVRRVLVSILRKAGYAVMEASDGQEAIDVFRIHAQEIDCVLLDLSMPRVGGEEAFGELRKIRPGVPVVLSSGFAEQEIMDRFDGAGLASVVQKPAKMEVLLARIGAAIQQATT